MRHFIKHVLILWLGIFISCSTMAQDGWDDNEEDVPLDGGLTILLAGAAAYGARKMLTKHHPRS